MYLVDQFGNAIGDANPLAVKNLAVEPGHDSFYDRTWGGAKCKKTVLTASGLIKPSGPGLLYGYLVTVALSAAAITIYDNSSASGTVIGIIAASAPIGTVSPWPGLAIPGDIGLYASFGGTGTVLFLWL